jgi:hypothetical protein
VCRRCGGSLRPGSDRRSVAIANELTPFLYQLPPLIGIRVHFFATAAPRDLPVSVDCCWCLLPTSSLARMHISKSWIDGVREFQATLFYNDNSYLYGCHGNAMVTPFVCSVCRFEITAHVHRAPLYFNHDDSVIVEQLTHPYLPKALAHLVLYYYRSSPSMDSDSE